MAWLELKDLGLAKNIFGTHGHFDENIGYQLDQEATVLELLHKLGLKNANTVRSPIEGEHLK